MRRKPFRTLRGHTIPVEELVEAGQLIAKRLSQPPRTSQYKHERLIVQQEAAARGELLLLPSYASIHRVFPVWDDFLRAAGLPPLGGRRTSGGHGGGRKVTCTIELCTDAINTARAALGDPVSAKTYAGWRSYRIQRNPSLAYFLPSLASIYRRFDSWNTAVLAAIEVERRNGNRPVQAPLAASTLRPQASLPSTTSPHLGAPANSLSRVRLTEGAGERRQLNDDEQGKQWEARKDRGSDGSRGV